MTKARRESPSPRADRLRPLMATGAALGAFLIASLAMSWPALRSGTGLGAYDWDQHAFYYMAPLRTLLEYGQFPFWNPWYCGGNPAFANPQFPAFSLTFAAAMGLGVPFGLKVSAAVHAFLGMVGGWLLARALGIDRLSSVLAGLLLMGSTVYWLHVAAGHTVWFPIAYIPWALWAYVRSRDDLRWACAIGVAWLALALHGQLYFLVYVAVLLGAWAILDAIDRREGRPILAVAIAGVTCGALGAIKWIPLVQLLGSGPFELEDRSSAGWLLWAALFSRWQSLDRATHGQPWGWWEYGAYVGVLPALLALVGIARGGRRMLMLAALAGLMLWIAAGWDAGLWPIIQRLPVGGGLRVPSRVILLTVCLLGVLAAAGLGAIRALLEARGRPRLALAVTVAALAVIAADLTHVSRAPLVETFDVAAPAIGPPVPYEQVLGARRFDNRHPYATLFPYLEENRGVVNCFERFRLRPRVTPKSRPDGSPIPAYRGEAYVVGAGEARVASFSPNRFEVEYATASPALLVLNQNYHSGWRVDTRLALDRSGLVATEVPAGRGRAVFWYRPRYFALGALVSAASVVVLAGGLVLARRWRPRTPAPGRPARRARRRR